MLCKSAKKQAVTFLLGLTLFATTASTVPFNVKASSNTNPQTHIGVNYNKPYLEDRVIVVFNEGCSNLGNSTASEDEDIALMYELTKAKKPKNAEGSSNTAASSHNKKIMLYKVLKGGKEQVKNVIKKLKNNPNVAYAEPDYIVSSASALVPNDEHYSFLYGMNRIQAQESWDITTGSTSVIVGVMDTGIDYNHPDLMNNMWKNPGELPDNNIDDDENGYVDDVYGWDFINDDKDPLDDRTHGTHVAGTISARGNNSIGVTGTAWNIKMAALKIINSEDFSNNSALISAINYSSAMGFPVTNASIQNFSYSAAVKEAFNQSQNSLYVIAAGNQGRDTETLPQYPGSYDCENILCVANTNRNDNLYVNSNYGATTVDIAAPGTNIYSCIPNKGYGSYTGTSMASPHVAGAAALLKSIKSSASAMELKNTLMSNVDKVSSLENKVLTGGRLNIYNALRYLAMQPVEVLDRMEDSKMNLGTSIPLQIKKDFSIEMWVNPESTQTKYANILDMDHSSTTGLVIQQNGTNLNNYCFGISDGKISSSISYTLQENKWQHIVFQREGESLKLFVNGELKESTSCFTGNIFFDKNSNATLGYNDNYSRDFTGKICGFKVFNYSISQESIKSNLITSPLVFNGTTDGANLGKNFPQSMKNNFTVEMWVKPNSTQQKYANILDFNHRNNVGLVIQQDGTNTNKFGFCLGSGNASSAIVHQLQADTWQHLAFIREGTTLKLFVNGKQEYSQTCFSEEISYLSDSEATVGFNKTYGRYFNGEINGLRFYNYVKNEWNIQNDMFISSFTYNGSNEGINAGSQYTTKMKNNFTISMWVKPQNTQQKYANIIDFNHRGNLGLVIQQDGSNNNKFGFGLGNGSTSSGITYQLKSREWQHIAFQRQGGEIRLYVNGLLVDTQTCFTDSISYLENSEATIGFNKTYGRYFNGQVRNINFSENALSVDEIKRLMNR